MRESVVRPGRSGSLVGVLTEPARRATGRPAFLVLSAGVLHRVGPSRLHVNLSRRLAAAGFLALRFDLSGLGDSPARQDGLPYHESRISEAQDVMDYLQAHRDIDAFVAFGLCSGADHAFRLACADPRVVGAVILDGYAYRTRRYYLCHYGRRLFRLKSWSNLLSGQHPIWDGLRARLRPSAGPLGESTENEQARIFIMDVPPQEEVERKLQTLVQRNVRLFFIYTGGRAKAYNYPSQFSQMFPSVAAGDRIRVDYRAEYDHNLARGSDQEQFCRAICGWAEGAWPASSA